jgi:hypothetical protein
MTQTMRTLADVRADLDRNDRDWSTAARRQMREAVDRLARLTASELTDLPGDETALIAIVDGHLNWRKDGFKSANAFRDFRGRLARAARETGQPRLLRFTPRDTWLPTWRALLDDIEAAIERGDEKPWTRRAIAHLAGYANNRGLDPDGVDNDLLAELLAEHARNKNLADTAELRAIDYARKAVDSARAWNRLVREKNAKSWLRNMPANILEWDGRARLVNPPLSAYPEAFQADVDAYLWHLAHGDRPDIAADPDDPLGSVPAELESYEAWEAANGDSVAMTDVVDPTATRASRKKRDTPLTAATIRNHRWAIVQTAGAVVRRGLKSPGDLQSLRDICTYPGVHASINDYVARQKAKPDAKQREDAASAYQLAETIATITEGWCGAPAGYVGQMRALVRNKVKTASCKGMSVNRQRMLRTFDQPWAMIAWFDHPIALFEAAEQRRKAGKRLRPADVTDVEVAVLCRLLGILPVRRANIVTLRHKGARPSLQLRRHAGEKSWIFWQPDEVKNGRYLRAEIDRRTERMIRTYLTHWRPHYLALHPDARDSDFLLPGRCVSAERGEGYRSLETIGTAFSARMAQAGLEMTMHLARHLNAKIIVNADPRLVGTAAELLGITEATARKFYLTDGTKQASDTLKTIIDRRLPEIRREWVERQAA